MTQSQDIAEFAKAFCKVQSELTNPKTDSENPFYKSRYLSSAGLHDHIRGLLAKNGICYTQPFSITEGGGVVLRTLLIHTSGQWIESSLPVIAVKQDPQGLKSAMTILGRAALEKAVGVSPVDEFDDDGNEASILPSTTQAPMKSQSVTTSDPLRSQSVTLNGPTEKQLKRLFAISKSAGWSENDILAYIDGQFSKQSTKDLNKQEYESICNAMQADVAQPSLPGHVTEGPPF